MGHVECVCHLILTLSIQQKNDKNDRGQVIILFQDMLEVVTRDIMEDLRQLSG
jgi:callose synthase